MKKLKSAHFDDLYSPFCKNMPITTSTEGREKTTPALKTCNQAYCP